MQEASFDEGLEKIRVKDPRYTRDAYIFVREALDHTQKTIVKDAKGRIRHVSGQELLEGIRDLALAQFGPMATTVLEEWGIQKCQDFGEIVFNMVENDLLAKTDKDSRADFASGYDFFDAFRKPYLPSHRLNQPKTEAPQRSENLKLQ
ncbi:MAG TPA: Minf_1886 family protein [Candidatus Dormibacteraeota bacterium]|nr:Minf_1886 family protein [Candidatus Dormibacteraeota bacterium]